MRVACLLLLVAGLSAAESAPLTPPVGAFEFNSNGHLTYATDGQPSLADNGVTARYEGLFLSCDHLQMTQAPVLGTTASALSSLLVMPGPKGPSDNKVLLDTRDTTSPLFGFKGLLKPDQVTITRLPPDPAHVQVVRYSVDLPGTGDFSGLMQMKEGWAPFRGWSEHTELTLEGSVASGQLGQLRVVRLVLRGRSAPAVPATSTPAGDPVPATTITARPAEINRLKTNSTALALDTTLTTEQVDGHIDAPEIIIDFDASGRLSTHFTGAHTWGDPRLFNVGP